MPRLSGSWVILEVVASPIGRPRARDLLTVLGYPIIQNGRLEGVETGKVSSLALGKGLIGAVRSPTFIIEQDSILVRAAGRGSILRIIIDNFQLIQDPIYGEMEEQLDHDGMKDYHIDLSPWKGHKFYVEVGTGQFERGHKYSITPDAWAAIEYAVTYNPGSNPQARLKTQKDEKLTGEVERINRMIRGGTLKPSHLNLKELERNLARMSTSLYDSTFFRGMSRGDYIESPVFIRGNHHSLSPEPEPHHFLSKVGPQVSFDPEVPGRLQLAKAILHPDNPLTARVMVNRLWHHLFGLAELWKQLTISASRANRPPTWNCWITWRSSSGRRAGRSSR